MGRRCRLRRAAGRRRSGASWLRFVRVSSAARGEIARVRQRLEVLEQKAARLTDERDRLRTELGEAEEAESGLAEAFAGPRPSTSRPRREALGRGRGASSRGCRAAHAGSLGPTRWRKRSTTLAPVPEPSALVRDRWRRRHAARARRDRRGLRSGVRSGRRRGARRGGGRRRRRRHAGPSKCCTAAISPARCCRSARRVPPRRCPSVSGEPLRWHVRARTATTSRACSTRCSGAVIVVDGGWATAVDIALAHPGPFIVTRDGDRFGVTGWRVGGPGAGATGAALAEARERAAAAMATAEAADLALVAAQTKRRRRPPHRARGAAARSTSTTPRSRPHPTRSGPGRRRRARRRHRGRIAALASRRSRRANRVRAGSRRASSRSLLPALEVRRGRRARTTVGR